MMSNNRNTILAVILSGLVLIGWQYFYNIPQMEKQRAAQQAQSEMVKPEAKPATGAATSQSSPAPATTPATPASNPSAAAPAAVARDVAIAANPRVKIDTPRLTGSVSLKGARIDDLSLVKFRETVDPASPAIDLFSPSGTATPY
jgi:YidC/Oxa1 family membrane protein insertase